MGLYDKYARLAGERLQFSDNGLAVGDEQKALLAFTQHFAKLVRPPAGKQIDNQCSNIARRC